MITCSGLVVGVVESIMRNDVLKQCARFLNTHRYLLGKKVSFEIDGVAYCTMVDSHDFEDGEFGVLFHMYDGFMEAVGVY